VATTKPVVTGRAQVGHRIAVIPGTWGTAPAGLPGTTTLAYQWLRNGIDIAGATSPSYSLGIADVGTRVSVAVTASRPGFADVQVITPSALVAPAALSTVAVPSVRGTARTGSTLTAVVGTWSPTPTSVTFRWLRDGKPLTGVTTTRSRISLGTSWRGHTVSVRITVNRAGYLPTTVTTRPVRVR
jgi:hypothetical protein